MSESRRDFLARTAAGLAGAVAAQTAFAEQQPPAPTPAPAAGAPPAFGTSPPVGPAIAPATITEAQKLVRLEFTQGEKEQIAGNWQQSMAATMEHESSNP